MIDRKKLTGHMLNNSREIKSPNRKIKITQILPTERKNRERNEFIAAYERNCRSTINQNNRTHRKKTTERLTELAGQVDKLKDELEKKNSDYKNMVQKYETSQKEIERLNVLVKNIYQEYVVSLETILEQTK